MLSIGQVAKQLDIGVETVRYYEREGLLEEPARSPSGYRQYDDGVVKRLQFIRQAKAFGFTLKEIKELLSLRNSPGVDCAEIRSRAVKKIVEIRSKIESLDRIKSALEKMIQACPGTGALSHCPIVAYLDFDDPNNN